jgi:hypothetical protein
MANDMAHAGPFFDHVSFGEPLKENTNLPGRLIIDKDGNVLAAADRYTLSIPMVAAISSPGLTRELEIATGPNAMPNTLVPLSKLHRSSSGQHFHRLG